MTDSSDTDDFADSRAKIKAMRSLREKIDTAIDKILHKEELTMDDVTKYLEDPKNFTESQYKLIKTYRNHLKSRFAVELDPNLAKKVEKKKLKKMKSKRARKSLGHRRKWIQMD